MDVFKKFARSVRGFNSEGSLESFYGAIASRTPEGGPHYSESKRDFAAVRYNTNRYMLY